MCRCSILAMNFSMSQLTVYPSGEVTRYRKELSYKVISQNRFSKKKDALCICTENSTHRMQICVFTL